MGPDALDRRHPCIARPLNLAVAFIAILGQGVDKSRHRSRPFNGWAFCRRTVRSGRDAGALCSFCIEPRTDVPISYAACDLRHVLPNVTFPARRSGHNTRFQRPFWFFFVAFSVFGQCGVTPRHRDWGLMIADGRVLSALRRGCLPMPGFCLAALA